MNLSDWLVLVCYGLLALIVLLLYWGLRLQRQNLKLEAELGEDSLVWVITCPKCGKWWHVADIGFEQVNQGQVIDWTCSKCGTRVRKTVGKDEGIVIEAIQ